MMDSLIRTALDDILSEDRIQQGAAFMTLLGKTEERVDWAYDAWDELVQCLAHRNNRTRAIAAQVLCNLAKSDPQKRMLKDFSKLLQVTRDERFVTARHCLQSLWKVGIAGKEQQAVLLAGLEHRFRDCAAEKNCTLIRYDIIQVLRTLYEAGSDDQVRRIALRLIETEPDKKYRAKYASLWKDD